LPSSEPYREGRRDLQDVGDRVEVGHRDVAVPEYVGFAGEVEDCTRLRGVLRAAVDQVVDVVADLLAGEFEVDQPVVGLACAVRGRNAWTSSGSSCCP
jgi:hypothetical protein